MPYSSRTGIRAYVSALTRLLTSVTLTVNLQGEHEVYLLFCIISTVRFCIISTVHMTFIVMSQLNHSISDRITAHG